MESSQVPTRHFWDFSIVTGLIVSLSTMYTIQCVRLLHMPIETRNRLTMTVWWSLLFNLIALEIEDIIMLALNFNQAYQSENWKYALNSSACFFFTNAIIYQILEWDLLGSMIKFQAQYPVSQLNVVRDKFNQRERLKIKFTKRYLVGFNVLFHLVKIVVPITTLAPCYNG